MLAGVAAGLARYFDLDVAVVRVALVVLVFVGGVGIPLYGAAWLLVPEEGSEATVAGDLLEHLRAA
jgi:phage shock protein PspC (stress-responsive transcriptional regulator)